MPRFENQSTHGDVPSPVTSELYICVCCGTAFRLNGVTIRALTVEDIARLTPYARARITRLQASIEEPRP